MTQNLFLTILLATLIMGFVIAGLSIGLVLTGKSRLRRGCGLTPGQKKDKDNGSCSICGDKKVCDQDDEHSDGKSS